MTKRPIFFGFYASPNWLLAIMPFILVVAVYLSASHIRHQDNPQDKLLPSIGKMADAVDRLAFTKSRRTDTYVLLEDTLASLKRLSLGVLLAAVVGLWLGLNMALYPGAKSLMLPFMTFLSMIPPLAILPILFISFGVDELAKVMLIFLGVFPMITRDIYLATSKIPVEQITKALTLGASQIVTTYRIILPQIIPRLIDTIRLSLGAAWLFLIAAEAIASTDGLGYRIFLVRRYLAMDTIIPYVLWITFLGFTFDWLLQLLIAKRYAWYLHARS